MNPRSVLPNKAWRQGCCETFLALPLSYITPEGMAGGIRTRDQGVMSHVVPRAFATATGKATTRGGESCFFPPACGGDHVLPPAFAAKNRDRPDRTRKVTERGTLSRHVFPVGHSSPDGKTVTELYLHGFDFAHPMLAAQLPGGEPRQHLEHGVRETADV